MPPSLGPLLPPASFIRRVSSASLLISPPVREESKKAMSWCTIWCGRNGTPGVGGEGLDGCVELAIVWAGGHMGSA